MTLKVRINGQMRQITGPGNSPVTFVNGAKKKLVKGVTFINGAKKVLWNSQDLKIDIISDVYNLFGREARVIWASNNKVILSTKDPYSRTLSISRWNIENKSNPIVENTVALGSVVGYSSIDTTDGNMVYYAVSGEQSAQQININPDTAEITASNPLSFSSQLFGKLTGGLLGNSDWLGVRGLSSGHAWNVYLNTTLVDSFSYLTSGAIVSGGTYIGLATKRDTTSYLLHTLGGSLDNLEHYLSVMNSSGIAVGVNNANYDDILVDTGNNNNIVLCGRAGFGLYSSDFTKIAEDVITVNNTAYYLLGRIRDYYYVIQAPYHKAAPDKKIYLRIYNTVGELFEVRQLSLPEFEDAVTEPILTVPHISQTGALGFWFGAPGGTDQDCVVVIQGY